MSGKRASLREHRTGRKAKVAMRELSDSRMRDRPIKNGRKRPARVNQRIQAED